MNRNSVEKACRQPDTRWSDSVCSDGNGVRACPSGECALGIRIFRLGMSPIGDKSRFGTNWSQNRPRAPSLPSSPTDFFRWKSGGFGPLPAGHFWQKFFAGFCSDFVPLKSRGQRPPPQRPKSEQKTAKNSAPMSGRQRTGRKSRSRANLDANWCQIAWGGRTSPDTARTPARTAKDGARTTRTARTAKLNPGRVLRGLAQPGSWRSAGNYHAGGRCVRDPPDRAGGSL